MLYACKTWQTSKRGRKEAGSSRKEISPTHFGLTKNDQTGEYEIRSIKKIKELLGEKEIL